MAIKLVERVGGPTQLDCSRAHGHASIDGIGAYKWSDPLAQWIRGGSWTEYDSDVDTDGEDSTTPASLEVVKQRQCIVIRMFEILIASGALRDGSLSQLLEYVCTTDGWGRKGHAQAVINEMRRQQTTANASTDLSPTTKTIVEVLRCRTHCIEPCQRKNVSLSDPNSIAVQLIQLIPAESDLAYKLLNTDSPIRDCDDQARFTIYPGYPLRTAIQLRRIHAVEALLKHIPVLETDVFIEDAGEPSGYRVEGPEEWLGEVGDADKDCTWHSSTQIERLLDAALQRMIVYRRERSLLIRSVLADILQYDLFDLIDGYGARPTLTPAPNSI
jgi:hypothetical protein